MKILVTGHMGFIGSHAFWKLKSLGFNVVGIDRKTNGEVLSHKLLDKKFDVIVHCAARLSGDFESNVCATKYLVVAQPDTRIIFMSSAAVYGNALNARERDALDPFGEYGKAKVKEEGFIKEHSNKNTILRLGNVYGYGTDHGVFHSILDGCNLVNYPSHIRDFVHIDDVVWAIVRAVQLPINWSGTFNIGSGRGTKIKDLFEMIAPHRTWILSDNKLNEINYSILNIKEASFNGYEPKTL